MATAAQRDPTRTAGVRRAYGAALRRRMDGLKRLVWETIVTNDALYLEKRDSSVLRVFARAQAGKKYDWPTDPAGKADAFMDWLQDAIDSDILGVEQRDGRRITLRDEWQNMYVRSSYSRSVEAASTALKRGGLELPTTGLAAVFGKPIHANTLAILYTRNFNELRGITEAMSAAISRELTTGMAQGLGPRQIAALLNQRVDRIGITRALTLARTEIIHAYADGTLNRYEEFGVKGVRGKAELSTAGDDNVCPICASLDGREYSIAEARGVIPVHPNCRCAWLPVI
jgi:SPP1 gp7 family putative phage head morphogenesis protein